MLLSQFLTQNGTIQFGSIYTARKQGFGQGNIFRSVCQSFCVPGGIHGRRVCVAEWHAWQGVCVEEGVWKGVCMAGWHV